jgi:hypothetical protein
MTKVCPAIRQVTGASISYANDTSYKEVDYIDGNPVVLETKSYSIIAAQNTKLLTLSSSFWVLRSILHSESSLPHSELSKIAESLE